MTETTTDTHFERRDLLKLGLTGAAGLVASACGMAAAADPTPAQTEGPFHPKPLGIDRRLLQYIDQDSDLTFVSDAPGTAYGQVVYLTGRVEDGDGKAIQGALIEIWQACISGKYNHRADPNTDWLDPHFQYWGRATSDPNGRFTFKTIVPGAYQASSNWIRPPHVHCKISRRGFKELTTQFYFEGVRFYYGRRMWSERYLPLLNRRDGVLSGVPANLRRRVIARARDPRPTEPLDAGSKVVSYTIGLERLRPARGVTGLPAGLGG